MVFKTQDLWILLAPVLNAQCTTAIRAGSVYVEGGVELELTNNQQQLRYSEQSIHRFLTWLE